MEHSADGSKPRSAAQFALGRVFGRGQQLSTGVWYDREEPATKRPFCAHGNPNVLTRDAGTSRLAQGCTGQLCLVEIERFHGPLPPITAYDPPRGGP